MPENESQKTVAVYGGYDDLCARFGLKKGSVYSLVSRRLIPHKRIGKRHVLFSYAEIEQWIESGGALEKQVLTPKINPKKKC